MQTLPKTNNRLLKKIYVLRHAAWQLRMRIPSRFAVYAVLLVVAGAVAFQNVRASTLDSAYKGRDRLSRFFQVGSDGELITEGLETLQRGTGGNGYLSAGISLPALALASPETSESLGLLGREVDVAVTDATALADMSISLTTIAERPREGILTYTVQSGDTLSTIAEEFGIDLRTLLWANSLTDTSTIEGGDTLKILPVSGVVHKVVDGDTLSSIAQKYQASQSKIESFNNLTSASAIKIGQELIIPGGVRPAPKPAPSSSVQIASTDGGSAFGNITQATGDTSASGSFSWPSACSYISQPYGWHTGIDIACPHGSSISAADGGTVISAGWEGGYGNAVVIDHGNGFKTRYAHLASGGIHVQVGQAVSRGQRIGDEGSTGWSTGPHLHFEILLHGAFQNPLNYL